MQTEFTKEQLAEAVHTMAQPVPVDGDPNINHVIITEGDKLTIISQHDIIVCLVESIRPRNACSCGHDKAVEVDVCCSPEAIQELGIKMQEIMKRNGKN